jgi:prephenate dehydratase
VKVAYLGPEGTFTEEAALAFPWTGPGQAVELLAASTIPEVIQLVAQGDCEFGCIPIENSIEGSVNQTLDALAFASGGVEIVGEIVRPIRHALLASDDTSLMQVTDVVSHPHAAAQCRDWLAANTPEARVHAANSTAEAARTASTNGAGWAAIGTKLAGSIYGLTVLADSIEDRAENATRFVTLGTRRPEPSGNDKTSLVCFIEADRPGSLLAILHEFSDRQINLSKLESRPTKERLGEYCFFIDCDGHADQAPLMHAINSLSTKIFRVEVLGSYPKHVQ